MTFKELHETYTRPELICGIYKVINLKNNKIYIGKSTNIKRRWQEHCSVSSWKKEPDKPLYKAIQKYGIENFNFEILEVCDKSKLGLYEKYWISKLHAQDHNYGYNIKSGGNSDGFEGDEKHPNHKLDAADVRDIRTRYANHERRHQVEKLYENLIGHSGFVKIWQGVTWSDIMPEVYTEENKAFHKSNCGCSGSKNGRAILNEEQVKEIRERRKRGEDWQAVYEADYRKTGIKKSSFHNVWLGCEWKTIK